MKMAAALLGSNLAFSIGEKSSGRYRIKELFPKAE